MIIRTPLRISLIGGGSDLRYFYENFNAGSIGFPIQLYTYSHIRRNFTNNIKFNSLNKKLNFSGIKNCKEKTITDIIKYLKQSNFDINLFADIAYGSGLGSSSSNLISIINSVNSYFNLNMSDTQISEVAFIAEEKNSMGVIGKQDHYTCNHGGINQFIYNKKKTVIKKIFSTADDLKYFSKYFYLIKIGSSRQSIKILKNQKNNILKSNSLALKNLNDIVRCIPDMKKALIKRDFKIIGQLINYTWEKKKSFSNSISNKLIDNLYDFLIKSKLIYGGKLVGAGGSGYLLIITNLKNFNIIKDKINYECFKVEISSQGSQIINYAKT